MSPMRAAGWPPISTVGWPATIEPPCTVGSPRRAAGEPTLSCPFRHVISSPGRASKRIGLSTRSSIGFGGGLRIWRRPPRSRAGRPAAVYHDHRAGNEHTGRVDINKVAAHFQRQHRAGFDHEVHSSLDVYLSAGFERVIRSNLRLIAHTRFQGNRSIHLLVLIPLHCQVKIAANFLEVILTDLSVARCANGFVQIILDADILVDRK